MRAEVAEAKKAATAQPDTHDYSEAETRDYFIDLLLKEAGWPLDQKRDREFEVSGMPDKQGKGFTVIALADLLMRCNWVKRVLFLADRVALVSQAVGAFKRHLPDASPVNLVTEKNAEGRVFVSTYPTMRPRRSTGGFSTRTPSTRCWRT